MIAPFSIRPLLLVLGVAALTVIAWRSAALASAARDAAAARTELAAVAEHAQEVLDLRAKRPTTGMGPKPADDLTKLVTVALKDAGIPSERLRTVSPDAESKLPPDPLWPGVNRRRQTARVTLEPLTPTDLGVLVQAWRASQSVWGLTSLELSKINTGGIAILPSDPSYRVHMTLAATYVDGPKRP